MGLFWDLLQQSQIQQHDIRAASVEQRLERAEAEIARLNGLVRELVSRLEIHVRTDLDGDGRVG
jgi:hypothetical protein